MRYFSQLWLLSQSFRNASAAEASESVCIIKKVKNYYYSKYTPSFIWNSLIIINSTHVFLLYIQLISLTFHVPLNVLRLRSKLYESDIEDYQLLIKEPLKFNFNSLNWLRSQINIEIQHRSDTSNKSFNLNQFLKRIWPWKK